MLERAVVDRFSSLGLRLDAGSDTRHWSARTLWASGPTAYARSTAAGSWEI